MKPFSLERTKVDEQSCMQSNVKDFSAVVKKAAYFYFIFYISIPQTSQHGLFIKHMPSLKCPFSLCAGDCVPGEQVEAPTTQPEPKVDSLILNFMVKSRSLHPLN